ncbi:DUF4374 domain-containing protein [Duncaniella freteri]|uniref:DUF4374 domain-containing protein n=5 Tax=Duncaniella TaxID=2518495 RepID=A0A4Z0V7L7_9BACT|nr:DUF4374 domain-containing protein [uncultured Duncaniella sp.]TGG39388.1 DUF4374 domain-containing protein [Duncaniella freteri]
MIFDTARNVEQSTLLSEHMSSMVLQPNPKGILKRFKTNSNWGLSSTMSLTRSVALYLIGKTVYAKNGNVYIPINITDGTLAIYKINTATAQAVKGLTIDATDITGFGYMQPTK